MKGWHPSGFACYALKIHLMVNARGQPGEFFLTPGSLNDTKALKLYAFDLPEGATITGDKAYDDYRYEDLSAEAHRRLVPLRRRNSKRAHPPALTYLMSQALHAIETSGSLLERLLPKHIHSVTAAGFELKTAFFIPACSLNFLFRVSEGGNLGSVVSYGGLHLSDIKYII
nr:transposase [Allochromatium tepidum]